MGSYFLPPANYFFKDVQASGNIYADYIIGNIALSTGGDQAAIPPVITADIRGNIIEYVRLYAVH